MPSTDYLDRWGAYALQDADKRVDLYVTFGKDEDAAIWQIVGRAYIAGACLEGVLEDGTKIWAGTSFNEWRKTPIENALASTESYFSKHSISFINIYPTFIFYKEN